MTRDLHVGVIGVGRMGALHVQTLQSLVSVASVVVADAEVARARELAREVGVTVADTPEELFESGIDAVVIATATPGHAPLVRLAAANGVPAFCEKPVALELGTLDVVQAEVERAGTFVQVGFQRRFDAGYRAARDAVSTGALGNLLVVRAATHDPAPPSEAHAASRIAYMDRTGYSSHSPLVVVHGSRYGRRFPWSCSVPRSGTMSE